MESYPMAMPEREQRKSFDLMASVDMMRFDLQRTGDVSAETWQRVRDEELSAMAEGINRASCTQFKLRRKDGDLIYFDKGEWRPYMAMLMGGLEVARAEEQVDYRKAFLHEWAVRDVQQGFRMEGMQPGDTLCWTNAYPKHIEQLYSKEFLRNCGLFPDREMGFIYVATCDEAGNVVLESQTVDRSDADAFAAVMAVPSYDTEYDMDTLVRTYDGTLVKKYGGRFYAGRRNSEIGENVWNELLLHSDLIDYYLHELQRLAASDLPRPILEARTKSLVIGTWKAFKNRLDGGRPEHSIPQNVDELLVVDGLAMQARLAQETRAAYQQALVEGDVKTSCGGSLRADRDPLDPLNLTDPLNASATFDSIFGEKKASNDEESYKFDKHMFCVVCQTPPKQKTEAKKMCGPCGICKGCDKHIRAKAKGFLVLAS